VKRPLWKRLLLVLGAYIYASYAVTLTQAVTRVELPQPVVERVGGPTAPVGGDGCWTVSQAFNAYTRLDRPAYTWGVTGRYCVENGRIRDDPFSTVDIGNTHGAYGYTNGEVEAIPWGPEGETLRLNAWGQFEVCVLRFICGGWSHSSMSVTVFADGRTPVSDAWT